MQDQNSSLINIVSVPTLHGIKTIEIYSGDITKTDISADLLAISAFKNNYFPSENSLIGALHENLGINIGELSQNPSIDLRESLNCWVSDDIKGVGFKRIICLENIRQEMSNDATLEELFKNLFATISLMDYKGISTKTIILPLLGTGDQKSELSTVLNSLISLSIEALNKNTGLESIYFIDRNVDRVELIDETVNEILQRDHDLQKEIIDSQQFDLFNEILKKLLRIKSSQQSFKNNNSINNLISKILSKNIRFYEIGILSRKIVELLMRDMTDGANVKTINDQIYYLQNNYNVATWMTSYIHVLKNLSNYAAHESNPSIFPQKITEKDRIVFSYSLNRFLEFYLDFKGRV